MKVPFIRALPLHREEGIRSSLENSIAALRGTKKIDLFQRARIDKGATVEDVVTILSALVKEGKFDHIGLSECRAETLRRGHAVGLIMLYCETSC